MLPGTDSPVVASAGEARRIARKLGFPLIIKAAAMGGGGPRHASGARSFAARGPAGGSAGRKRDQRSAMRRCSSRNTRPMRVTSKSKSSRIIIGNVVHLWERDCSVQRRHQKVVEVSARFQFGSGTTPGIVRCRGASRQRVRLSQRRNRRVSFRCGHREAWYFIEVNPRIQVEHTVTEMVTGIDLVALRSQILITQGCELHAAPLSLPTQENITIRGAALQCRVTTGRSRESVCARLREDHHLSLSRRPGHPLGRRIGLCRCFCYSLTTTLC